MSGSHRHGGESCRELLERLSEYVDGELAPGLCSEIDAHMADCPPCQRFVDSLRRTVGLIASQPAPLSADEVRGEVQRALEELRRSGG